MAEQSVASMKDLRSLSQADLNMQLDTLRQELWQHRTKVREGSMQQTHLLSRARRQIARIQMLLREQQSAKT